MQFRRQSSEPVQVNMTPLIDVVFLLLIFFMVTTSFPDQQLNLQLPTASSSEPRETQRDSIFNLALFADGRIQLDDQEISDADALKEYLQTLLEEHTDPAILIRAEQEAPHQRLVMALDIARQLGIQQLRIATRPPH
ncbi:biopolymer transport protein ExbD [Marinospirillum celere]|uniref:Biopolymer transport protein ExbD n=1 Tax=Marinospirillum celere TaxID=1122252 RepID=A0A1I1E839_9GAMM|nr:biopolymer transporter ExbD [Marinospirillum celere]SFB83295.1 biopolymer transport protein ExbD [Marinospirillum celere]